jgi:hypothetical protein
MYRVIRVEQNHMLHHLAGSKVSSTSCRCSTNCEKMFKYTVVSTISLKYCTLMAITVHGFRSV